MQTIITIITDNLIEIVFSAATIISIIITRGKNPEKIQEQNEKKKAKAKEKAAHKAQSWADKFKKLNEEDKQ